LISGFSKYWKITSSSPLKHKIQIKPCVKSVLRSRIHWIRKILAYWPDPRGKISTKNCKKKFDSQNPNQTIEKEIIKIS
jgi:hypothetical protein